MNLELASPVRPLELFGPRWPIYTLPRFLSPSEVRGSCLDQVLMADGCYVRDSGISNSVIGLRSSIGPSVTICSSVIIGAEYYETDAEKAENKRYGRPDTWPTALGYGPWVE